MQTVKALSPLENNESQARFFPSPNPDELSTATNMSNESSYSRKNKRFIPDHKKPDAALTFPEKVRNYAV
jgi:hypothetical protein